MKVKVISLPYIFQVLYVLCLTRPRYQVSVYRTIGPLVILPTVRLLTLSNIEISKTSGPIAIKIHMKHRRGVENGALGFGPHRIGTLVSMATDSSHIYVVKIGEHLVSTLASSVFISLLHYTPGIRSI